MGDNTQSTAADYLRVVKRGNNDVRKALGTLAMTLDRMKCFQPSLLKKISDMELSDFDPREDIYGKLSPFLWEDNREELTDFSRDSCCEEIKIRITYRKYYKIARSVSTLQTELDCFFGPCNNDPRIFPEARNDDLDAVEQTSLDDRLRRRLYRACLKDIVGAIRRCIDVLRVLTESAAHTIESIRLMSGLISKKGWRDWCEKTPSDREAHITMLILRAIDAANSENDLREILKDRHGKVPGWNQWQALSSCDLYAEIAGYLATFKDTLADLETAEATIDDVIWWKPG